MNKYKLQLLENGDWYLDNYSPMYPTHFENKINKLAGEKITETGLEVMGGLMPGFINSFCIKKDKIDIFQKRVLPFIGYKSGNKEIKECACVWDKDEECEANDI